MELLALECKEALIKINLIAACPPGRKLNVGREQYVKSGGWSWNNINRTWSNRETKDDTLEYIDQIIVSVHHIFMEPQSRELRDIFVSSMEKMTAGLENLKATYKKEPIVVSTLGVYLEQVSILIRRINDKE